MPAGTAPHYSVSDRLSGYQTAIEELGLKPNVFAFIKGETHDLRQRCLEQVKANPQITAWICYGDSTAVIICHALEMTGITVGKTHQVATVSAGISMPIGHMKRYPILLTPHIWAQVGQEAVKMLMNKITNPNRRQGSQAVYLPM